MDHLPTDLPLVHRSAVRAVVLDDADNVLLLRAREVTLPELGSWWELPGGGLEDGETARGAVVRELREETGLRVDPDRVDEPTWHRSTAYRLRGVRRVQDEAIVRVRVAGVEPLCDGSGREGYEREDYTDFRWATVTWIEGSGDRFFPGTLPLRLRAFLSGETLHDPFELWS